jgi:tetratricopeptide (TPR) repeat protein
LSLIASEKAAPVHRNRLARLLAMCPLTDMRDVKNSTRIARQLTTEVPDSEIFWNTLGAAHYRAGESQQALQALEQAVKGRSTEHAEDWFLLAMARYQSGDSDRALEDYNRGLTWLEENAPHDIELRQLQAEAAKSLQRDAAETEKEGIPEESGKGAMGSEIPPANDAVDE